jgi:hypothetical protein
MSVTPMNAVVCAVADPNAATHARRFFECSQSASTGWRDLVLVLVAHDVLLIGERLMTPTMPVGVSD